MFKHLQETIKSLNADVKTVANCERAKKLRCKLLKIGLPMAIVGYLAMFVCFALFALSGPLSWGAAGMMIPFLLFLPCAAVGGFGSYIASLGFKIVVTGYTTDLIDEAVGNNCPKCGETINSEMLFCVKCGSKVRKECSKCKHVNSHKHDFCEKCGNKLN